VKASVKASVKAAAILPEVLGSEHCPVSLDFE
jgi:exonuclease III